LCKMFANFLAICLLAAAVVRAEEIAGAAPTEKFDSHDTSTTAQRDALMDKLFKDYNVDSYPENSTVYFGLNLMNADLNEEKGLLSTNVWFTTMWSDNRLTWDEKAEGVHVLRIPAAKVWRPDTTIYNGVDQSMKCVQTNILLYSSGRVLWVPPCRIESFCNITLAGNPYAVQECEMKFGSWVFDGLTMGFDFFQMFTMKKEANLDHYMGGQRWKITKNTAERNEKFYDCCKEPYISLSYHLGFQKVPKGLETCTKE